MAGMQDYCVPAAFLWGSEGKITVGIEKGVHRDAAAGLDKKSGMKMP